MQPRALQRENNEVQKLRRELPRKGRKMPVLRHGKPPRVALEAGKTDAAHQAVSYGAMILAGTVAELIRNPERMQAIRDEFRMRKSGK